MKRYGLLIGYNGDIKSRLLRYAEHDSERIFNWLQQSAEWRGSAIYRCVPDSDYPPNLKTVNAVLDELAHKVRQQDFTFIYAAGHTVIERGAPYLVLPNSQGRRGVAHYLSLQYLFKTSMSLASSVMLVLDCCSAAGAASGTRTGSELIHLFMDFGEEIPKDPNHKQVFFAASAENEEAFEGVTATGIAGGYFTTYFIQGCDGGGQKLRTVDNFGIVSTSLVNHYIGQELRDVQRSYRWMNGDIGIKTTYFWRWLHNALYTAPPEVMLFPLEESQPLTQDGAPESKGSVSVQANRVESWPKSSTTSTLQCFANENALIAIGYKDNGIDIVDLNKRAMYHIPSVLPDINGIRFLFNTNYLAVKSALDQRLHIFNAEDSTEVTTLDVEPEHFLVVPGTNSIVTCSKEGTVALWAPSGSPAKSALSQYRAVASAVSTEASRQIVLLRAGMSGKFFVTADRDNTMLLWSVDELKTGSGYTPSLLPIPERLSLGTISALTMSPDERFIAAGFGSGHTLIWSSKETQLIPFNVHHTHNGQITGLEFSLDSQWIATIGGDGYIRVTNLEKGPLPAVRIVNSSSVQLLTLAFFPEVPDSMQAPLLAVGMSNGRVLIHDISLEQTVQDIPQESTARRAIFHLAIAHQNASTNYLLVGSLNKAESWTLVFKPVVTKGDWHGQS